MDEFNNLPTSNDNLPISNEPTSNESANIILTREKNRITNELVNEKDPEKVNEIYQEFIAVQRKMDAIRSSKLTGIRDIIDDTIIDRITTSSDEIKDTDLINYWKTTSDSIDKTIQNITDKPIIQINSQTNNQININSNPELVGMNQESKNKVISFVTKILDQIDKNQFNTPELNKNQLDVIDIIDTGEEDNE